MKRFGVLGALVFALSVGCAGAPAATPVIIYVTPPPVTAAPSSPSSPSPTPSPTPKPTATPAPVTHDITIVFTLYGGIDNIGLSQSQTECFGHNGYDDIQAGMQASVQDAQGTVIGFATFENEGVPDSTTFPQSCAFTTVAKDVPDAPVYGVEIGRRGKIQFSRTDLAGNGWKAELSIGT